MYLYNTHIYTYLWRLIVYRIRISAAKWLEEIPLDT